MPSGKTHFTAGLVAGMVVLSQTGGPPDFRLLLLSGGAAMLPDIDTRSKAGKWIPLWILFKLKCLKKRGFRHRGFTHSYFALLLVILVSYVIGNSWIALAVGVGYLSHIWLDWMTHHGVMLWWPNQKRSSLRKILRKGR